MKWRKIFKQAGASLSRTQMLEIIYGIAKENLYYNILCFQSMPFTQSNRYFQNKK